MTTTEPRTEPLKTQGSAGNAGKKVAPRPVKRRPLASLLTRFWLVLLIAAVVALSGFVVHRLHGVFGVHKGSFGGGTTADVIDQFNAKTITLEVWGSPGSTATINYLDENSHPQQALNVPLPWNTVLSSTKPGIPANLVAQGDGSWIACRFVVDNHDGRGAVIKGANQSPPNESVNAFVYCLDKSA
ncbi:MAG: MmpS family transport accessory protein [Mycobacterium sp.]